MYWYVATLAIYVVVMADNEAEARTVGIAALKRINPKREYFDIKVVRPATNSEIYESLAAFNEA